MVDAPGSEGAEAGEDVGATARGVEVSAAVLARSAGVAVLHLSAYKVPKSTLGKVPRRQLRHTRQIQTFVCSCP